MKEYSKVEITITNADGSVERIDIPKATLGNHRFCYACDDVFVYDTSPIRVKEYYDLSLAIRAYPIKNVFYTIYTSKSSKPTKRAKSRKVHD